MPAPTNVPVWADGPAGGDTVDAVVDAAPLPPSAAPSAPMPVASFDEEPLDLSGMESPTDDAPLADWLALARDGADQFRTSEARSHAALYRAIGLAYDFALVAQARPDDYAELLADCGIKVQARSPMTAIIKLVFGAGYDKTRITEYATVLDHGRALGLGVGMLADHLSNYAGGLKALVRDERALRRAEAPPRPDKRETARNAMKAAAAIDPQALAMDTDGLAIVVARREADGSLALVAQLPEGSDLAQRVMLAAAR